MSVNLGFLKILLLSNLCAEIVFYDIVILSVSFSPTCLVVLRKYKINVSVIFELSSFWARRHVSKFPVYDGVDISHEWMRKQVPCVLHFSRNGEIKMFSAHDRSKIPAAVD